METTQSPCVQWIYTFQYYEEMGKPTPKVEVMKFLKSKQYTDAKDFAGECESVVMIAKGQSTQPHTWPFSSRFFKINSFLNAVKTALYRRRAGDLQVWN